MKKEIIASIITLSSMSPAILMASDPPIIVNVKAEANQDIYETLKILTVLKAVRVDRESGQLKINLNKLPYYLVTELLVKNNALVYLGELTINEDSIKTLSGNKTLKALRKVINPNAKLEAPFNELLKKINDKKNFDLREDLDRYSRTMFS